MIPFRHLEPVPATTDIGFFVLGEPVSDSNPMPVTRDTESFKAGEPVSDSNPLPVKLNEVGYLKGEPFQGTNPLPVSEHNSSLNVIKLIPGTGRALSIWPTMQLSAASISESAAIGAVVGALSITGGGGAYTYSIIADPGLKFAIAGGNLVTGAALDYETAASHLVTVQANEGDGSPISQQFAIGVTNVFEAATLGILTLSVSQISQNVPVTVNILGATPGSTITGSVPEGLVLNSAARTITGTPTIIANNSLTLTETLADSSNSPKANAAITLNVVA